MKDVDFPVLVCWVTWIVKEVLSELVFFPNVDCTENVSSLILVRESAVDDGESLHNTAMPSSQQV